MPAFLLAAGVLAAGCPGPRRDTGGSDGTQTPADCTATGCTAGKTCNETTKLCVPAPVTGGTVGDPCAAPGSFQQGTCAAGGVCLVNDGGGMCTRQCTGAGDCGANGTVPNVCIPLGEGGGGLCARGCTPGSASSCGRSDFTCATVPQIGSACGPDCRVLGNECSYTQACDRSTGACKAIPCGSGGACAGGQVCDRSLDGGMCVSDCRLGRCPTGLSCRSDGTCVEGTGCIATGCASGQICDVETGQCRTAGDCTIAGCPSGQSCNPSTRACETTADCRTTGCPSGQTCANTDAGYRCTTAGDCRTTGCPSGQTCAYTGGRYQCTTSSDCLTTGCPSGQTCAYTDDGYRCTTASDCLTTGCPSGQTCAYTADGYRCTTASDCRTTGCLSGQTCTYTETGYRCTTASDCRTGGCPSGLVCTQSGTAWICTTPAAEATGSDCSSSSPGDQGTCPSGYICIPFGDSPDSPRMCTKECTSASECGRYGSVQNACFRDPDASSGLCVRSCTGTGASCGRSDLACQSRSGAGNACFPDCRQAGGECGYGMQCSSAGGCQTVACSSGGTCTGGMVCWEVSSTQKLCVPPCGSYGCPEPLTCDSATQLCVRPTGTAQHYQPCSDGVYCVSTALCIVTSEGAAAGACMQTCTNGETCPGTDSCDLQTQSGTLLCARRCTSNSGCPSGTTCQSIGSSSSYCLPPG